MHWIDGIAPSLASSQMPSPSSAASFWHGMLSCVRQDILDCDAPARRQIGDFPLKLQDNPLPQDRRSISDDGFYIQLPCGFYLSWEIIGDLMRFALGGKTKGLLVRVLGVARVLPP